MRIGTSTRQMLPLWLGIVGTSLALGATACSRSGDSSNTATKAARVSPTARSSDGGVLTNGQRFIPQARTYYASETPKNSVSTFLNRLATTGGQLVVTRVPVAAQAQRLVVPAGHDLYLVETQGIHRRPLPKGRLPGEIARLKQIAFVTVPRGELVHDQLGRHDLYAEKVSDETIHVDAKTVAEHAVARALPDLAQRLAAANGSSRSHLTLNSISVDVDRAFLETKLKEFSGAMPTQVNGQTVTINERGSVNGRTLARAWLKQQYEALGFTVSLQTYAGAALSFAGGTNFVADRPGQDPNRYLIVSAHLDSVSNAGADDDGAGTISALAVANALKDMPIAIGLRIVGFDQEEQGLVGSGAYARFLAADTSSRGMSGLVGVVNLEMTGYDADNDGGFHAIDCNENTSASLTAQVRAVVARDPLRLNIVAACTNRSDHAVFWRYNKPAIVISQNFFGGDSNPCYHLTCDRTNKVNFDYMQRVTTAVARSVATLVGQP